MKAFLLTIVALYSISVAGQTITPKPIYKGSQNLEIKEMNGGAISFIYQDSNYKHIVAIASFWVESKSKAIEIVDKALFIIGMEKTDKDQHINDRLGKFQFVRYGFSQKEVGISDINNNKYLWLGNKELLAIKSALEKYSYTNEINK